MNKNEITELLQFSKELTLLYVEDNEAARIASQSMLENFFAEVVVAVDGIEAWDLFQQNHFDLVITDINMPNMNGLELVEQIRIIDKTIPILILSAYNESGYFIETIRLGIDGYMLKPIEIKQFTDIIGNTVHKIRLTRENEAYRKNLETMVQQRTKDLAHLFNHDPLTGLKNRQALKERCANNEITDLGLIDINHFAAINDHYGTRVGDEILIKVAKLLRMVTTDQYELFKLCGDHFVFANTKGLPASSMEPAARKILNRVSTTPIEIDIDGFTMDINILVTIALVCSSATSSANEPDPCPLESSKLTLKYAKKTSQPLVTYTEDLGLHKKSQDDLNAVQMVKKALDEDRITPFYQPILKKNGVAYEALARIVYNDTVIAPAMFINGIKKTPYYHKLTKTIIKKTFATFKERTEDFSINLSFEDIISRDFTDYLKEQLKKNTIASQLILEIVETDSIENFDVVRDFVLEMRMQGIRIAIDDFGSGYSNFVNLIELQPDFLKIDGSLIKNIATDRSSTIITQAIAHFSRQMGIEVIAEYVHNREVYLKVQELGISGFQGFFCGKPQKKPYLPTQYHNKQPDTIQDRHHDKPD